MRNIITAAALFAAAFASPALASDGSVPLRSRDVTSGDVVRGLEQLGYRVDTLKIEHGRYEVRAVNDSGFPIKLDYDRATGELVRARLR